MAFSKRTLIMGALTLTAANIITRLIGFAYRIFMANAIGAEGMGLFQLIMPVYSLAWAICCSGITTTLSRLVAAEQAKGAFGNMRRLLWISLGITTALSLVLTGVLFFVAEPIGTSILNEGRIVLSLQILSFSFVFMAVGSCIRGYFLGLQKTIIPATSQIIEQIARIGVVLLLASAFIPRGLEYAAAMAVLGIVVGEALSFVYVAVAYKWRTKKEGGSKFAPTLTRRQSLIAIAAMAAPLTLNRITSAFLSTVENVMIPARLQAFGMAAEDALATFGQITGMAMPLIFFPSAILVALSVSLVPSISESIALGNTRRVNATISKSIVFTSIVAFGAALIFVVFPNEIGQIVYRQDLGQILLILGLMCPFWYFNITLNGLLNGLGEQIFIFRNSLLASGINIAFVYFFVPIYGVTAFLVGWLLSLVIVTFFTIRRLRKISDVKPEIVRWFVKPALAAFAAGLTVNWVHDNVTAVHMSQIPAVIVSLTLLMGVYAAAVFLLRIIRMSEVKQILSIKSR
ncbi:MAG: polysaccharide biosynthesis protein [Defluviitaleaceae bacterium]|nr:polysaccharide biosynthesis protein [Defluviitaleaceae bacterium]